MHIMIDCIAISLYQQTNLTTLAKQKKLFLGKYYFPFPPYNVVSLYTDGNSKEYCWHIQQSVENILEQIPKKSILPAMAIAPWFVHH